VAADGLIAINSNVIKHMDSALLTLAHDGSKAYREAFDLLHRREASKANEIWQADNCLLDIHLINDKNPDSPGFSGKMSSH
jgi:hypothetical protein